MTEQRDEWREILRRWGYYGIIIPGLDHGHSFQRMSEDTGVPARRLANWAANLPRLLAYEVPPPSVAEHLADLYGSPSVAQSQMSYERG